MTSEGNTQSLRDASAGWREMGKQLENVVRGLDQGVSAARATHWQGPAAEAFDADWNQLKKHVDDALPVFELAAAHLDSAADTMDESRRTDATEAAQEPSDTSQPPAFQAGYALMALSQLGSVLGSLGARSRSGSQGRGNSLTRSVLGEESTAPRTADPFGPPETIAPRQAEGGLGIARGRRSPGTKAADEASPAPLREQAGATQQAGTAEKADQAGSADQSATAGAEANSAGAPPGKPEPSSEPAQNGTADAKPDTAKHGAFG